MRALRGTAGRKLREIVFGSLSPCSTGDTECGDSVPFLILVLRGQVKVPGVHLHTVTGRVLTRTSTGASNSDGDGVEGAVRCGS